MAKRVNKASEEELADLEALQGGDTIVKAGGKEITVKAFRFGQLLKVIKYLSVLGDDLDSFGEEIGDIQMIALLASHTEEVLSIMKLAVNENDEFFENLESDEGVELALAVWEVNKDFFIQRIQPKLKDILPEDLPEEQVKSISQKKSS